MMIESSSASSVQLQVWLAAMEEIMRDYHGDFPREISSRLYRTAFSYWMDTLLLEQGIRLPSCTSLKEAIESFLGLCVSQGLLKDLVNCEIRMLADDAAEVSISRCPFRDSCLLLINKGVESHLLTCPFMGLVRAAASRFTDRPFGGDNTGIDPLLSRCQGMIERSGPGL